MVPPPQEKKAKFDNDKFLFMNHINVKSIRAVLKDLMVVKNCITEELFEVHEQQITYLKTLNKEMPRCSFAEAKKYRWKLCSKLKRQSLKVHYMPEMGIYFYSES